MKIQNLTTILLIGMSSIASANPTLGAIAAELGNVRIAISVEDSNDSEFEGCVAYMKDNSEDYYVDGFCVDYDPNSGNQATISFDESRFYSGAKDGAIFLIDTKVSWDRAESKGFAKLVLANVLESIESSVDALESGNYSDGQSAQLPRMPIQMFADFLKQLLPKANAQITLVDDALRGGRALYRYLKGKSRTIIETMQTELDIAYKSFQRLNLPSTSLHSVNQAARRILEVAVERTGQSVIIAEGSKAYCSISVANGSLIIHIISK